MNKLIGVLFLIIIFFVGLLLETNDPQTEATCYLVIGLNCFGIILITTLKEKENATKSN